MTPEIGLLLPTRAALLGGDAATQAGLVLRLAERAEAAGCAAVWVGDSLTAKPRLDPLISLAAVAARTSRVRIGTSVLLGALYQPVLLARAAASLDLLSGGRLVLAMGVGGVFNAAQAREWAAVGVEARGRAGRLEELVELLPRLWRGEGVTFRGEHFRLDDVVVEPRPANPAGVPIWLACHHHTGGDAQYRRAARLADGIMSITDSPDELGEVWRRVRALAVEYGREPERLERSFYMTVNLNPNTGQAAEEAKRFVEQYYGRDFWGERWGPFGTPEAVVERIRAYAAAGAGHVVVRFASFDQARQMDLFERHVLPSFV